MQEERDAALSGNFSNVIAQTDRSAPVNNGAWGAYVPVEKPSNAVLQGLNELGFSVNVEKKKGLPKGSYASKDLLQEHSYEVSERENKFLREAFNRPTVITGDGGSIGTISEPTVPSDMNMPLMNMEPTESAALTWEAYDSLDDQQKAAVDWNTLLIDAREKDFTTEMVEVDAEARAEYDAKVERLFGKEGGSERYAPNTINLLDQLDVVQLGQDLDEYLSLERAIDDKQLVDFKFSEKDIALMGDLAGGGKEETSYADVRTGSNLSALDTTNIQAASELIQTQLQNPAAITADFNTLMYGNPEQGVVPLGFGDSVTDDVFRSQLAILGAEDPTQYGMPAGVDPLPFILEDLAVQGADQATQDAFLSFVSQQAQLYSQYGSEDQKLQAELVNKRAGLGG